MTVRDQGWSDWDGEQSDLSRRWSYVILLFIVLQLSCIESLKVPKRGVQLVY